MDSLTFFRILRSQLIFFLLMLLSPKILKESPAINTCQKTAFIFHNLDIVEQRMHFGILCLRPKIKENLYGKVNSRNSSVHHKIIRFYVQHEMDKNKNKLDFFDQTRIISFNLLPQLSFFEKN